MKTIRFIYNPVSGPTSRNANLIQKSIASIFSDFEYDFFMTTYKGNAQDLAAQAIDRGFDTIIAIGGDGTLNEILQVSVNKKVKLAIIPTGSGNSISNYIGMNRDLKSALQQIKNGTPTLVDCFQVTHNNKSTYGLASFSFGLSGDSFFEFDKYRKKTIGRFTILLYKIFKKISKEKVLLNINGSQITIEPLEVIVTNINQFGMNVKFMKEASMNNGKLNIYIVHGGPYWRFLRFILLNYLGFNDFIKDLTSTYDSKQVSIQLSSPRYAQLDAESIEVNGEIEVKLIEKSINLIIPKNTTI